ncbi:MAG: T9SS type A sorting domain-containing protein [Candidatus Cloacimonetes bacterium]|nr:T9SS type A sorting domain-containing protein [Candidatus Cloacimonadota bacterium]
MLHKRACLFILCMTSILFVFTTAQGEIISVPDDFTTIQQGINNAVDGDTILVNPGTYYENINFSGKNITLTSHYIFSKNPDFIFDTVIDGSTATNPYETSTVIFKNNETEQAILQGFTIKGGSGTRWVDPQYPAWTWFSGGGIFMYMASPTIKNNLITENIIATSGSYGGLSGGGLLCFRGNPEISNNIVSHNEAEYGGGIVVDYSGAMIKNNIVAYNSAGLSYGGGGFYCIRNDTEPIIIENNTIVYNHSDSNGGGIRMYSSSGYIRNCIVWGNTQNSGGTVHGGTNSTISYCDIDAVISGIGNINEEPVFADTLFHLTEDSPCIDAGDPEFLYYDKEDTGNPGFALYPAMGTITNDMGAYGGPGYFVPPLSDDDPPVIENMNFRVFPNPFNNSTTISMSISCPLEFTEVTIYNMKGQLIQRLQSSLLHENPIEITWNGRNSSNNMIAPGVYFVQAKSKNHLYTRKILKLE